MSDAKIVELNEAEQIPEGAEVKVVSKQEKKALKHLKGTGIKPVTNISRVVLRKRGGVTLVIDQPSVYRTPNNAFIVFGEPRVQEQDIAKQLAALTGKDGAASTQTSESIQADLEAAASSKPVDDDDGGDDDGEGLDAETIKIIMDQANCSRAKAIKALRKNNSDIVNAIMELTE